MTRDESRALLEKSIELANKFSRDIGSLESRVDGLEREVDRLRAHGEKGPGDLESVLTAHAEASKEKSQAVKAVATTTAKLLAVGGVGAAVLSKTWEWGAKAIEWAREALHK